MREEDLTAAPEPTEGEQPEESVESRFGIPPLSTGEDVAVPDDTRRIVTAVLDGIAAIVNGQPGVTGGRDLTFPDLSQFLPELPGTPEGVETPGGGPAGSGEALGRAAPEGTGSGATTGSLAWGGHENGRIPDDELVEISGGGMLEPSAAAAWEQMREAAAEEGVTLTPSSQHDTYRPLTVQQRLAGQKPNLAATPGTSNHGWARAVDITPEGREWVQRNGERFGWIWPEWARPGGSKPEGWHFEFRGEPETTRDQQARSAERTLSDGNIRAALHGRE